MKQLPTIFYGVLNKAQQFQQQFPQRCSQYRARTHNQIFIGKDCLVFWEFLGFPLICLSQINYNQTLSLSLIIINAVYRARQNFIKQNNIINMMEAISMTGSIDQRSQFQQLQPTQRSRIKQPLHPISLMRKSPFAIDTRSQKTSPKRNILHIPKGKKKRSYLSQHEHNKQIKQYERYIHNHQTLAPQSLHKNKKKKERKSKSNNQTFVDRYEQQKEAMTVLSIRFASNDDFETIDNKEEAYIKAQKGQEEGKPQKQQTQKLPYLRYRKFLSPEQQLKQLGYSSDTRLASEIYSDKVQEKKNRYVNKMEALKKQLEAPGAYSNTGSNNIDVRRERIEKSRIQVKILGEQIRRNRERQLIKVEERKGKKLLQSLLKNAQ